MCKNYKIYERIWVPIKTKAFSLKNCCLLSTTAAQDLGIFNFMFDYQRGFKSWTRSFPKHLNNAYIRVGFLNGTVIRIPAK
jgi:hypothetical protein